MLSSNISRRSSLDLNNNIKTIEVCTDSDGTLGFGIIGLLGGIFISNLTRSNESELDLKIGDQIVLINNLSVAAYSSEEIQVKYRGSAKLTLTIRNRDYYERSYSLTKDSGSFSCGLEFNRFGKIIAIARHSRAARQGALLNHYIVRVDSKDVLGLTRNEILNEMKSSENETMEISVISSDILETLVGVLHMGIPQTAL